MSILINSTLDTIRQEFLHPTPKWTFSRLLEEKESEYLRKECHTDSEFDPHNRRRTLYNNMVEGISTLVKASCPYGQVIVIFDDPQQMDDIPWGLWGRILRMYTEEGHPPFTVFFLANTNLRTFPSGKKPITATNINGGYTYPCNRQTIMIYRAEDATRVLLHELMHSCCLDNHNNGVDRVEAETEAWAELIYIALLSQGKKQECNELLRLQSEWMMQQNKKVKEHMRQPESMEFPWRYTIGKEEMWRKWNILRDQRRPFVSVGNSLRLTCPLSTVLKTRFQVRKESTIL
jgi:hypothetical protein